MAQNVTLTARPMTQSAKRIKARTRSMRARPPKRLWTVITPESADYPTPTSGDANESRDGLLLCVPLRDGLKRRPGHFGRGALLRFCRGVFTMKRLFVLGCLAGAFAACNPDIPNTPPSTYVIALFDPSNGVAPSPNVLSTDTRTRLLAVPIPPGASPAQVEFVTDFLNKLDGFPRDTPARATFQGDLVPISVNASSVRILDLSAGGAPVAGAAASYVAAQSQIVIPPPATGWPNGHVIAVVLIAGPLGLQSTNGVPVVGSPTWALVRSKTPLVTCTTLFLPDG